jgi:nicotinate-nucleotide adenylyltransferase
VRVGILGGSFDPIHNAHLVIARLALEQLRLERVHFVVAAAQPFKQGSHGATAEQRLRMVELAVRGLNGFVADGRELARPAPSYTIDTLRELAAEFSGASLVLIMGDDVARGLSQWRDPAGIRGLASLAICRRGETTGVRESDARAPIAADEEIRVPMLEISSTAVRARARAGQSVAGWVPQAVDDYIVASQIYRSNAG